MKFAILQIGDIHFKEKGNAVADRAKKIKQALQSLSAEIEACVIAVAGDVAFSGGGAEYAVAETFFSELRDQIGLIRPGMPVEFVVVPGNHDCDLGGDQELRDDLIDSIPEKLPALDPSKSIVRQILQAQDGFFDFLSRFQGEPALAGADRLYYERVVQLGEVRLRFNCYNTAWLARMGHRGPKVPLHYPVQVAQGRAEAVAEEVDFVVSIFHYPYGWLDPDNAMPFKRLVDSTSDFILTGHEHSPGAHRKEFSTGGETFYSEGDALQETDPPHSGFNVILFDEGAGQIRHAHFAWEGSMYAPTAEERWLPLRKNSLIKRPRFQLTEEFARELAEEGYGFRHPRVRDNLRIRDLFVYPDLIEEQMEQMITGRSQRRNVEGSKIHQHLDDHPRAILFGEHQIGKTTLGKVLYGDFIERGLHPLFFNGPEAKSADEKRFLRSLRRAYEAQYGAPTFETYKLLDKDQRVLIVDEFHLSPLNPKGKDGFLKLASGWFGRVIVLTDEMLTLQMLTAQGAAMPFIREFRPCMMRQLGWRKRNQLIRKWLRLGREQTVTDEEIEPERKALADTLDRVLGKNVFPATPFMVISALQSYEAARGHAVGSGAIGYIYEALITTAVHKISTKPTDLERIYAFLSQLAYQMFVREKSDLNEHEIREIAEEYFRRMAVAYDVPKLLSDLLGAHIMRSESGFYRFEPRHFYYFFVARYFKDNLSDPAQGDALRAKIGEMIDTVHYEDYAHVLNFLIYFVKEPWMFERMRDNARQIYAQERPCDLSADVEFVNRKMTDVKPLELPPTTTEENQDEHLGMKDELEHETAELRKLQRGAKVQYSEDVDDFVKLNIAFKTLELMGQIVRNYPYTLPADTKEELVMECELLALRTMKAVFRIAENGLERCQAYYAQLIRERRVLDSDLQAVAEADQLLMWLTGAVGYSIVKRVSMAVGAQELDQIYRKVVKNLHHLLGARLIDVAIRFDHLAAPPVSEVEELGAETKKNPYAYSLLRDLVLDFLYLHHTDSRTRQKLGAAVDVRVADPRMLDNPDKRLALPPARGK